MTSILWSSILTTLSIGNVTHLNILRYTWVYPYLYTHPSASDP